MKIAELKPTPALEQDIKEAVLDALAKNQPFIMLTKVGNPDTWEKIYYLPNDRNVYEVIVTLERTKNSFLDWFEPDEE